MLRDVKRRFLYLAGAGLLVAASIPFLPDSFTGRMSTIQGYQSDSSAKVRLAVWGWTWDYAQEKPLGGGFGAYLGNKIQVRTVATQDSGGVQTVAARTEIDQGRAWHSAYFEMLGEQGFPGLILFLLIHIGGLVRMEVLRDAATARRRATRPGSPRSPPLSSTSRSSTSSAPRSSPSPIRPSP